MKHTKYIALLSVLFFAACTTELIEPSYDINGGDKVQLVSRVIPFSDCDVTTRANKSDAETMVASIDYLIFGTYNDKENVCIFHDRVDTTDPLLVDKSSSKFNNVDLSKCYIVSIANGPEMNIVPKTTTWDDVSRQSVDVSGVTIQENVGLLMIGRYPETGTFDFGVTNQGTVLTVPMKSLFSKIVFNISVDSDEIRPGENQPLPTFTLTNCTVHNVASEVDFIGGTESSPNKKDGTDDETSVNENGYSVLASGETVDGGTPLSFNFYLPERFLRAGTSSAEFTYPFNRDEEQGYRQRYKPLLAKGYEAYNSTYDATKDKKATFVRLKGVYSNHQGHLYDVSYDIYVGNDNYGNFDIVRNMQYNNNIIIKGINNSDDQLNQTVSIDHRVNIERSAPIIVSFRRETLLDSHFEVRPLRIKKNYGYGTISPNAMVKVEVEYFEAPEQNWIGLERSFGDGSAPNTSSTYLLEGDLLPERKNVAGKRKYFTTDLTTNTLNSPGVFNDNGHSEAGGTTVVVPITNAECVWVYVDECLDQGDDVRSAKVKVSYDLDGDGDEYEYSDPIVYVINQRLLFPVSYGEQSYNIEYHEEYLYNYDSEDQYGQTYYEGMKWGLEDVQLSYNNDAIMTSKGSWGDVDNAIRNALLAYSPKYDFYLERDIQKNLFSWGENDIYYQGLTHNHYGHQFCLDIIEEVNSKAHSSNENDDIKQLTLAQVPKSAIEYCYNRNKRNSDGNVVSADWYLPAIDEIEEIVMSTYETAENTTAYSYARFKDFQSQFYWSSQPAFLNNYAFVDRDYFGAGDRYGYYMIDDISRARATSVSYNGQGAGNPNNYTSITSGSSGFYRYIDADYKYDTFLGMPVAGTGQLVNYNENDLTENKTFTGSNQADRWTHNLTPSSPEEGNKGRDQKARVRCVRKMN